MSYSVRRMNLFLTEGYAAGEWCPPKTLQQHQRTFSDWLQEHKWHSPKWQQMPFVTGLSCLLLWLKNNGHCLQYGTKLTFCMKLYFIIFNSCQVIRARQLKHWLTHEWEFCLCLDSCPLSSCCWKLEEQNQCFKASAWRLLCKGHLSAPCENFSACGSK